MLKINAPCAGSFFENVRRKYLKYHGKKHDDAYFQAVIYGVGSWTRALPSEVKTNKVQFLYPQTVLVNY